MLVRTADPEDGRAQTLALTPAGRALVPALAALADVNDAEKEKEQDRRHECELDQRLRPLARVRT